MTTEFEAWPRREAVTSAGLRRRILRSEERFWRPSDFKAPASTVLHLLGDLTKNGELRRLRKGLYWRGTATPLGMSPPGAARLAAELAGTAGVGPAGASAWNHLGLSSQVPRRDQIAVPRRAPQRPGVDALQFISRPGQTGRIKARLSGREVAFLEVLGDLRPSEKPPGQLWSDLQRLLASDRLRPERLARAARTEPAATRARLSSLLNALDRTDLARQIPPTDPRTRARALASVI